MGFHLSEADTKSNPMKAVTAVQQMMYNWEPRDLWTQMSPDSFFSAVLLRSLHPSAPLRHDLLQEFQRFLRQQSLSPATSSTDKNPLFTFAATYLQTIQDSRKFVSNSNLNKPPTTPSPQTPGAASERYKPGGLELAAAASTAPAAASFPPSLLLLHPVLRTRIRTSMKARPTMSEPFVLSPDLFFVKQTYIFNTLQLVIPNVT